MHLLTGVVGGFTRLHSHLARPNKKQFRLFQTIRFRANDVGARILSMEARGLVKELANGANKSSKRGKRRSGQGAGANRAEIR
jgi:hypothetical protein